MSEWIRFWVIAVILWIGVLSFALAVLGVYRFGFVMNRVHASGIGDTMGLMCVVLSMMIASGLNFTTLKLFLLVLFMWITSPTSTHFLTLVELNTNPYLRHHMRMEDAP